MTVWLIRNMPLVPCSPNMVELDGWGAKRTGFLWTIAVMSLFSTRYLLLNSPCASLSTERLSGEFHADF